MTLGRHFICHGFHENLAMCICENKNSVVKKSINQVFRSSHMSTY